MSELKALLDFHVNQRNCKSELSHQRPDPLLVAKKHSDESIALICALFGYGNARNIVSFLESLDFSLLESSESTILKSLRTHYYRFQKPEDVQALFIALQRLKNHDSLENLFFSGYRKKHRILDGLASLIENILKIYPYDSRGYRFLTGSPPGQNKKPIASPYKRWNMFLRWMVRNDCLDMGLWNHIHTRDLIIPLDTHTFQVAHKVGLLTRKSYDFKAALELTETLKTFDPEDPVKYDFALYRIGQEKIVLN